jgi:hypothetical protein
VSDDEFGFTKPVIGRGSSPAREPSRQEQPRHRSPARSRFHSRRRAQFLSALLSPRTANTVCFAVLLTVLLSTETIGKPTPLVTGDPQTLVMVANFHDATVGCSVDDINSAMFADVTGLSVNARYRDSARGRVTLDLQLWGRRTNAVKARIL